MYAMETSLQNLIETNENILIKYNMALDGKMKNLLNYARTNHIPVLLEDTAKLLFNVAYKLKPKNILEIGTAIGYSGTLLLSATNANLTTIENYESNFNLAKAHFEKENLLNRVNMIFDDGFSAIQKLQQENKKFDFIFLDGPKGQYIKYLPILKQLLSDGGVLFSDNVYFKNMIFIVGTIPHRKRTIVVNLRKFLSQIKLDSSFESVELNVGDGVSIAKLKN